MKGKSTSKRVTWESCLLVLLLCLLVISCNGNTPQTPTGPVSLNLWMWPAVPEVSGPPANWDLYATVRKQLNINLNVSLIPVGEDGNTKLSAAAAANNLPDVFQITDNNLFLQWVHLGLVAPVDSLLPLMPQRTKARYSDPTLNKLATINGKMYILQEPAASTSKRPSFFIRQDWLDKLGLPAPKTLDDLLNVAKAFTFNDPDGDGKNDTYGFGSMFDPTTSQPGLGNNFAPIYGAFGVAGPWNYSTPGKMSLNLRDPGYLQATQFVKSLVDAKVMDPDWTTLKLNDYRTRWKQGKYGIFWEDFCAAICQANYQPFDQNVPNGVLVPLAPPTGPTGKSENAEYSNIRFRLGVSQKALSAGKGPAIAKLLEWLNSGDGYYAAGFGKKDVNYKLDAQGNISTDGLAAPFTAHEVSPFIQIRNLAFNDNPAEINVRYPSFKTQKGRTIVPLQVLQTIGKEPWVNATRNTAIQPAANQADINRYVQEGLVQFVTGQKPLDTTSWNTFIAGLDGLGVADWESASYKLLHAQGLVK